MNRYHMTILVVIIMQAEWVELICYIYLSAEISSIIVFFYNESRSIQNIWMIGFYTYSSILLFACCNSILWIAAPITPRTCIKLDVAEARFLKREHIGRCCYARATVHNDVGLLIDALKPLCLLLWRLPRSILSLAFLPKMVNRRWNMTRRTINGLMLTTIARSIP